MKMELLDPPCASEDYQRDGYVLLKGLICPDTIYRLRDFVYGELDRYWQVFRESTGVCFDDADAVRAYVGSLTDQQAAYHALDKQLQHLVRGEFPLAVRLSEVLRAIIDEQVLIEVLPQLLDTDTLRMHVPPMLRFKPPCQTQSNVPLHQDCSYNAHLETFVTVWVPLCPITESCGGVNVLAGSHRLDALEHGQQVIWGNCVEYDRFAGDFDDRHVLMELGDALLFSPRTLHYSHPNTSNVTRCSIDYRFFPGNTDTSKHYFDLTSRTVVAPE